MAREVVRLEHLAEQVADTSGTAEAFLANLSEAVHAVSATAAAFTCLDGPGEDAASAGAPPGPGAVRAAAATLLAGRAAGGRLAEPVLLAHLCWVALTTGRPLQLHARPGPRRAAALTAFAEATAGLGTDVVLLGGGGPHDHTARLAALHPHVYAGIGPVDPYGGPPVRDALAGALERAPFGKLMYASGAGGLPELHVVAAREFHRGARRGDRRQDRPGRLVRAGRPPGRPDDRRRERPARLRARLTEPGHDGAPAPTDGERGRRCRVQRAAATGFSGWAGTCPGVAYGRSRRASRRRTTPIQTRHEPSMCRPTRISGRSVRYWT